MGLLERIKSALGFESSAGEQRARTAQETGSGQDVAVTVEHEPDTTAEDAVKGTETEPDGETTTDAAAAEPSSTEEPVEAETETGADTDAVSEAEPAVEEAESSSVEPEAQDAEPDVEEAESRSVEPEGQDVTPAVEEAESAAGDDAEPVTEDAPTVESIKGIGPAYAERLAEADIYTVADLAAADAATVAETTGIAESRVTTWIDRAGE